MNRRIVLLVLLMLPMPLSAGNDLALWRAKADNGDALAQWEIGRLYLMQGDAARATAWFKKAAAQGHATAQFNLGELYQQGKGVPRSDVEAYVLFTLSGEQSNFRGVAALVDMRAQVEKKLSAAQREAAERKLAAIRALVALHPRKFGAPGLIGKSRGWFVWKKWNPDTYEAEVTTDPPGDVFKVRVLPWATTYRHLAYGPRFDELLIGEKVNMFFDADENHRRGYVVHYQDEISQMKGHGHAWKVLDVKGDTSFTAQIFAGDKPLDDKRHVFTIDPKCAKWSAGKLVDAFPLRPGERVYMTWIYREGERIAMLLSDDASLDALKKRETERIARQIATDGMAGRLENLDKDRVHFMIFSTHWAQAGQLKPGQIVKLAATGPGYRPTGVRIEAKIVSQKNRGQYGSGVNDVILQLPRGVDTAWLHNCEDQILRLIPGK